MYKIFILQCFKYAIQSTVKNNMSTYYAYEDVKIAIAKKLMQIDGWKVHGFHEDESDAMIDYFDPAYWGGIAEKNGYILCVNTRWAAEPQEIRKYTYKTFVYDKHIAEKIKKLEQMTVERGASEQEEASAKAMIKKLQRKAESDTANEDKYVVTGMIPGHMANPPKMNWHIEKDGIIIAKGNGILKYAAIENYITYPQYREDMENFRNKLREKYKENLIREYTWKLRYSDTQAEIAAQQHITEMEEHEQLLKQFEEFINKLDTTCGGLLGEGDGTEYKKTTVIKYKQELRVVETDSGEIKEGQLFKLKGEFSGGCHRGSVYRIHETELNGKKYYYAYKLNRKRTKECTGTAGSSNRWATFGERFEQWIKKSLITWCVLEEVSVPYEVEKVIKVKNKK